MRPILAHALLLGAFGLATATGAEPPTLPPPNVVVPAPVYYPLPHRVSRYEVWQYLGPTRQGFFRPRVISTPMVRIITTTARPPREPRCAPI